MVSAGLRHTWLLRSDGRAVAIGENQHGQCCIPALDEGMAYSQVSAGGHTLLLRSDGSAVAIGCNNFGQRNISLSEPGICYIGDMTFCRDLALQLEVLAKDDADTLILTGSTLVGDERFRSTARGTGSAWERHTKNCP